VTQPNDEAVAWLDTVAPEVLATVKQDTVRTTIIPPRFNSTAGGRAMDVLAQLSKGSTTSRLETGDIIGEGGMGLIRTATQVALGRTVAVKTLKPLKRDPAAALDLLREAWVTGALEHPNIVPVHYVELDHEGAPVIVMKRIAGVEWSKLLGDAAEVERRFGATDLVAWNLGILMHVLNAIRFAHSRGVVHRDLKPSNVMIGDFGEVYLLDWGIAVSLVDDGSGRLPLASGAQELAGTPSYMAPEMLGRGGDAISERTDVYLAGALLYELIVGRPPHTGATAAVVFASVIASRPVLPETVPSELAKICLRAMQPRATDRFASADEMRLAIQAYLEHRGSANLSARANLLQAELLARLAEPLPDADDEAAADHEAQRREEIYRLFGACRFGYHEALAVWPENADARAGLAKATVAVAEYELATDNPKAALALLGDLGDAPADLTARVRADLDAAARRQAQLERLHKELDPTLGRRTRMFLAATVGIMFTLLPLGHLVAPRALGLHSHFGNAMWAVGTLVAMSALAFWARNSMGATSFNRRIVATGVFVFAAQALLPLGAWLGGFTVAESHLVMIFLWGSVMALLTIHLDPWLWPSAVGCFIAFVIAARDPESRHWAMSASNLAFTINAIIRWSPETIRMTPEEREAMRRRDARASR
jgi:serine/threonine-protein kinase